MTDLFTMINGELVKMTSEHVESHLAQQEADTSIVSEIISAPPNLEPDQFWFILRVSGYEQDLLAWLEELRTGDPIAWAAASSKLEFAKYFERDHPFVLQAQAVLGISDQELDSLWGYAL